MNLIEAVDAVPTVATELAGVSGVTHQASIIGYDEGEKRLVILTSDGDARLTAFAQSDIQAAHPDLKVIVGRVAVSNLANVARYVAQEQGSETIIDVSQLNENTFPKIQEMVGEELQRSFGFVLSPTLFDHIVQILYQLRLVRASKPEVEGEPPSEESESIEKKNLLDVSQLLLYDPTAEDRRLGLCPIPLYEFQKEELETLQKRCDRDYTRSILERLDILQYFFPPPDTFALGLVEGRVRTHKDLLARLGESRDLGHPLSQNEILPPDIVKGDILEMLKGKGYLMEADFEIEISEEGRRYRGSARLRPKEGFITKFLNRVKINISTKDLFRFR
jgi:hypothetical protein